MSEPLVLALVAADVPEGAVGALLAGFEEESVPLTVERSEGTRQELARAAAVRALLGIGLGVDAAAACAVLAGAPSSAYLEAPLDELRALAQNAARIAGRRALRRPAISRPPTR